MARATFPSTGKACPPELAEVLSPWASIRVRRMSDLRERKRRRSMAHVQTVALDLFEERGFDGVTIDEIAERAEVSPSTIFRHFGTKEALVIQDEWDEPMAELLQTLFSKDDPLAETGEVFSLLGEHMAGDGEARARRRMQWVVKHPGVRRAGFGHLDQLSRRVADMLIERGGIEPLQAKMIAHAIFFGVYAGLEHWYVEGEDRPLEEVFRELVVLLGEGFGGALKRGGRPA